MKNKLLKVNREGMSTIDKLLLHRSYEEEITDYQAEMMLHALGADNKAYRTYEKSKYYHAYRNYYDAGGEDVSEWNDLVKKGYAEKHSFYHVTVNGIRVLEFLTQCRIWNNYHCVAECRYSVLVEMMKDSVFCGYECWLPTSSQELSLRLAIPKKLILETLRKLSDEGLVIKGHYGDMDTDGIIYCKHGWFLTEYAQEKYREKYEELKKAEYKKINDMLKEDLNDEHENISERP